MLIDCCSKPFAKVVWFSEVGSKVFLLFDFLRISCHYVSCASNSEHIKKKKQFKPFLEVLWAMFCFGALHIPGPFVGHVWGVCHNIREAEVDRAWAREKAVKEVTNESEKWKGKWNLPCLKNSFLARDRSLEGAAHHTPCLSALGGAGEGSGTRQSRTPLALPKHQVLSAPASTKLSEPRLLRAEPCCTACMQSCRTAAAALLTAGWWAATLGWRGSVWDVCLEQFE